MRAMNQAASLDNFLLRVQDVPAVLNQLEIWNTDKTNVLAGRLDLKRWGADIGADELCFIVSGGPAFSGYARRTFRH